MLLSMGAYLFVYFIVGIFKKRDKDSAFRLRKRWIRHWGLPMLNIKSQVKGQPIDEPAIYVCNHRSFSDPLIISRYLDAFVIAKAEIAKYPIINKGAEVTGIVWVDRGSKDSRAATRQAMIDVVKSGYNVLVYPEGTVGVNNETLSFKPGTFRVAVENQIPVVPCAIEYKSKKDLWLVSNIVGQYFRQFGKWKTETKLSFGPAVKEPTGNQSLEECHRWINHELSAMQNNWSEFVND